MNDKRLIRYLTITFVISWLCWGGLAILIKFGVLTFIHPVATVLHLIAGFLLLTGYSIWLWNTEEKREKKIRDGA